MEKQKEKNPKVVETTGSSVEVKRPASPGVHREGEKTYEAYADEFWDQAP
ncbi:MAG: hypothetical protein ACAH59_11275 [Pseudobdellovibrionaceae bacterium]